VLLILSFLYGSFQSNTFFIERFILNELSPIIEKTATANFIVVGDLPIAQISDYVI
jgi:hypothetical protein